MTLDVTIGKLIVSPIEEVVKRAMDGDDCCNDSGITDHVIDECYLIDVGQLPDADFDVCNIDHTFCPRAAYRSGSSGFWNFFDDIVGIDTYHAMRRNPGSNDRDIALLKPLINRINEIEDPKIVTENDETNADRLKWLKYWSNKAVELYGDRAAIMFT